MSYKWGCLIIGSASFLLAWQSEQWYVSYLSAALFGISYIFITGLLMVWGIKVFITNASLGIGTPFLLLAVGQVIGSLFAGVIIDFIGFVSTFVVYGFMGIISMMLGPRETKNKLADNVNREYFHRNNF